ncbi:MAG: SLC13 family permease [Candidatus Dormibacteria bacterium]
MLSLSLLVVLFAATCVAMIVRPFKVGPGWWAVLAALLALLTGLVSPRAAWASLGQTANVLTFFAGLILLTAVLRQVGAVELLMDRMEAWSGGSSRKLLAGTMVVTAIVTALFSNDAAALLVAPSLIARLRARGVPSTPFILAIAIVANSASLLLPVSNPVNLLLLDRDHMPVAGYLVHVTPAAVIGLLVTSSVLGLMSWRRLGAGVAQPLTRRRVDRTLLLQLVALLGVLAAVDATFAWRGLPLGPPTLAVAAVAVVAQVGRSGGEALGALRLASWSLLPLVAGLAVLAAGLEQSHLLGQISSVAAGGASAAATQLRVGALTALLAALVNNLPAAFLVGSGLAAAHHLGALAVPVMVGADLGPNLAPAGSLSTIVIVRAVGEDDEKPSWRSFWRLGAVAGSLGLASTLGVAALIR